jgi:hypothetical protein
VYVFHFENLKRIRNLGPKQVAVLESDFVRPAFKVNVGPSATLEAVGAGKARVFGAGGGKRRRGRD